MMTLLDRAGVDAVLQITDTYLARVITRRLYQMLPGCLDTRGANFPTGGTTINADEVVFNIDDVGFRYDDGSDSTFVVVTIKVLDGQLEVDGPNGMQPATEADLEYEIFINTDETQGTQLVLEADVGLDTLRDLLEALGEDVSDIPENDPRFELDIGTIADAGVTLTLAQNAGAVKILSDGTFAVGLNIDRPGRTASSQRSLDTFHNQFDESFVSSSSRDWTLTVDQWIIEAFIGVIDIDDGQSDLRNVSQHLDRITDTKLQIDGSGEGKHSTFIQDWWDFDFEADIQMEVEQGSVVANYSVTSVDPDSPFVGSSKVMEDLEENGQDEGTITIIPDAEFGQPDDPGGQYVITGVDPDPGIVTFFGVGSVERIYDPSIRVDPEDLLFAPTCSGNAPSHDIRITNPDIMNIPGERMPLQICAIEIEGADRSAFDLVGIPNDINRIEAGQSRSFTVRTGSQAMGGNHSASLVIRSNGGIKHIPLEALLEAGSVSGIPEDLVLDARQRVLACDFKRINKASEQFTISNTSGGAVEICNIEIQSSGTGQWSWSGEQSGDVFGTEGRLRPGYVLTPGDQKDLTITFQASVLDQFETATLTITTSAGTHVVDLKGRVRTASDDNSVGVGGFDYGAFGIDATKFCFEFDDIHRAIDFWDRVHDAFHDGWHRAKPICCPEPHQPYCLCENFMELSFKGLPADTRFSAEHEERYFDLRHPHANPSLIFPFPRKEGGKFRIDLEREVEGKVKGRMRNWQISRTGRWKSELPVTDIATQGKYILALNGGALRTFRIGKGGKPVQHAEFTFEESVAGVSRVGSHLVFPGKGVWQAGRLQDGELKMEAKIDFEPLHFVIPRFCPRKDLPNVLFGIGPESVLMMDGSQPSEPEIISQVSTKSMPSTGWIEDNLLYLGGRSGIQVYSFDHRDGLKRIGENNSLEQVSSITALGNMAFAGQEKGSGSFFALDAKSEFQTLGRFNAFSKWEEIMPFGSYQQLGRSLVSITPDRRGFNVMEMKLGRVKE
ncbi:hypothetical protein [Fodinibius roseus]|nr:hypothetical protein [Fodinibius roseus]